MPSMPKIFLSYRRADSAETTTRLYDRLVYAFGRENVFKDVDSIQRGDDFPDVLREWVMTCDVFLAVIGQKWLTVQDETGHRRIDSEKDWVRRETQMALERDKGVVLIPTIVDGASLPGEYALPDALRPLAFKDAQMLYADRFHGDLSALITSIRRRFGLVDAVPPLDLHKAHSDLVDVMRAKDWDAARDILIAIRAVGNVPAHFRLDAIESGIYKQVTAEQRNRDYAALARNADLVEMGIISTDEMRVGVEAFLQIYDSIFDDPANLRRFIPPNSDEALSTILPARPQTNLGKAYESLSQMPGEDSLHHAVEDYSRALKSGNSVEAALKRARTFKGKRNRDWTPFITTFDDLKISEIPFCLVPVGSFQMGEGKEAHPQTITSPYYIAQYPVTNAQWAVGVKAGAVVEPNGNDALKWYRDTSTADAPVVGVSWNEVRKFADWLGCRLPTELEWEYAARGVESLVYPWGNEWESDWCVWSGNSGGKPAPVSSRPEGASWVDAWHLSGNVWEWVSSAYQPYPYQVEDSRRSLNKTNEYIFRGGSWFYNHLGFFRAAYRIRLSPDNWDNVIGFRVARS